MQRVIEKLDELLAQFDENALMGQRWHTPTRQDFIDLTKCVKTVAETLQRDGEEVD